MVLGPISGNLRTENSFAKVHAANFRAYMVSWGGDITGMNGCILERTEYIAGCKEDLFFGCKPRTA